MVESPHDKRPPEIRGTGYIVDALEAALWALRNTRTFEKGVLAAVNLGDDADTTAAIFGQIAGTLYGVEAIPERWRKQVVRGDEILELADRLHDLSGKLAATGSAEHDAAAPSVAAAPPPGDAYWVDEGTLLAGPYPGAPTRAEAKAKLDAFLELGVTYFLDLTEEGDGPGPDGLHPYSRLLRDLAHERGVEVTYQRLPIKDVDVPTDWQMRVILHALKSALGAGEVAYVHCWGGVGRTGTVVGCHLIGQGESAESIPARMEQMRKHTARVHRVSPETSAQRAFVRDWAAGEEIIASHAASA